MPDEIMNKELVRERNEFKDLVNKELKNIELAEQMDKKKKFEKMRLVAKEEAAKLWHQKKEIEKAKLEAECKRQEQIRIEQERKSQRK